MHVLVTRPEPGASETRRALEAGGHRVTVAPVMVIAFDPAAAIDLDGVSALVATSRNGLRALAARPVLAAASRLPLFAVGPGTARAASELGFSDIIEGAGTGEALARAIAERFAPHDGVLLHLAGEDKAYDLAGDLRARGYSVRAPVLYRTDPIPALPAEVDRLIRTGAVDAVIVMSPRTADVFATLVTQCGLAAAARGLTYLCLSRGVAAKLAVLGNPTCRIAERPTHEALMALVAGNEA